MVSLIVGVILIAFCVFSCLPAGLNWGLDVINFLKGCAPVLAAFIGLIAVFIGWADIKDRNEAKKEAKAEEEASKKANEAK